MNKKQIIPMLLFFALIMVFVPASATLQQEEQNSGNELWTPEYMTENFKRVGATQLSPNGEWVAFTVSVARTEGEQSDFLTHIHLVKTDGFASVSADTRGCISDQPKMVTRWKVYQLYFSPQWQQPDMVDQP